LTKKANQEYIETLRLTIAQSLQIPLAILAQSELGTDP